MRIHRNAVLVLTLSAVCALAARPAAAQAQGSAPAAATGDQPCTATLASADVSGWKTVAAEGFTFCIPADWRVRGHTARGRGGQVSWGAGEYHNDVVRVETKVVTMEEANAMMAQQEIRMVQRETRESIDGRMAEVMRFADGGRRFSRVQFTSPEAWLSGEANSVAAAELQMNIYRTVRFGSR